VFIRRYSLFFRRSGGVHQEKLVLLSVDLAVFIMRYHCSSGNRAELRRHDCVHKEIPVLIWRYSFVDQEI
jgi:hypothetical protein